MKVFASVAWKTIETIGNIEVESITLRLKESSTAHATNNKDSSSNGKVKVSLTESSEDEVEEILAKAT